MPITLPDVIRKAKKLPVIPRKETDMYRNCSPMMTDDVNSALKEDPSILSLIGNHPFQIMFDNHTHHAAFMATVFSTGNYELLARTLPWVYRSYHARRFSYDYFLLELRAWITAIKKQSGDSMNTIVSVYQWMIQTHEDIIRLSLTDPDLSLPADEGWLEQRNSFQAGLLRGDHLACLAIARDRVRQGRDIGAFYHHIIQPVMYDIGMLWEKALISVAQEHLASAVASRVMATVGILAQDSEKNGRKAVITAAPNEFHEIGAWMVADVLTAEGWDIRYLGANTPQQGLLDLLIEFKPHVLGISVTMPFNIEAVRSIILSVKSHVELKGMGLIVGGRIFGDNPDLCRYLEADGCAHGLADVRHLFMAAG